MSIDISLFYWAWVDETETTFDPVAHARQDEQLRSFSIHHVEAKTPELTIVIINPLVSLLSPARKRWAWLSCLKGAVVTPLFFGQLVSIPDDISQMALTLKFISRSLTYVSDLQVAVEPLKTQDGYDPAFIDFTKRDDPMTILEGYSALPHIDRVTLATTISDVCEGEDGTLTFVAGDFPLDSFRHKILAQPLSAVAVDCVVQWTQESRGYIDFGNKFFLSYGGDGVMAEWPAPGADLTAGWSVEQSVAVDTLGISKTQTLAYSTTWNNTETKHMDGDTLSVDTSISMPTHGGLTSTITLVNQIGILDPFAVDIEGNPAPVNIPIVQKTQSFICPLWQIMTSMMLRYDAKRQRTEHLTFLLEADTQEVFVRPTIAQNSETITKTGINVGATIFPLENWTTFAGTAVAVGDVCFPNNPIFPGQNIPQICVGAGIAGLTEPLFQTVAGLTTLDGSVTWSSLGSNASPSTAQDWTQQTLSTFGQMIVPREPIFLDYANIIQAGLASFPQVGAQISFGQIVRTPNGTYQFCQLAGTTDIWSSLEAVRYPNFEQVNNDTFPHFSDTYGDELLDGTVMWQSLGRTLPQGDTMYLNVGGDGETGMLLPPFNPTKGEATNDGSIVWQSIGQIQLPVGGYPGNVTARSYFPTDRGQQSIKYLISLARARLRYRSRAVAISWQCRFDRALDLSCRKNATLFDFRLPGGQATGKITEYTISGDAITGRFMGAITVGCSVGLGNVVHNDPGVPVYVAAGYVKPGYQGYDGALVTVNPLLADVAYTPPRDGPIDDGLVFPLTYDQVVGGATINGSGVIFPVGPAGLTGGFVTPMTIQNPTVYPTATPLPDTANGLQIDENSPWGVLLADQKLAVQKALGAATGAALAAFLAGSRGRAGAIYALAAALNAQANSVSAAVKKHPVWFSYTLKPVVNGPFSCEYQPVVSKLTLPMTIDMAA